ncbi:MAG: hypothetical protein DI535_00030 [Citrobacter freundii]|nr:MAG: hypothetical protein DI535_00030 [Citrobacter freundii]
MFLSFKKISRYGIALAVAGLLMGNQQVFAADGPGESIFSKPLALALLFVMMLLAIVIGVLGYVLLGIADIRLQERKKRDTAAKIIPVVLLVSMLAFSNGSFAQEEKTEETVKTASVIGGIDTSTFYLMNGVIFLEFLIIMGLLVNIRFLVKKEKAKLVEEGLSPEEIKELKKTRLNWWDKMNKMKPISEEATLVLDHEYDGIRELNNRLPPWWLYGFYVTIIFGVFYLWRFHISHSGPSSSEEYIASVQKAEMEVREYLKKKGDAVDENTVKLLVSADDLGEGKMIFTKSCASCHKETGAGDVGPNLTDNYWLHGNDIKDVFKTIRYGINAMPQWQNTYSNKQIAQVASYVKSLHGSNPPSPKAPQGIEMKEAAPATDSAKVVTENKTVTVH